MRAGGPVPRPAGAARGNKVFAMERKLLGWAFLALVPMAIGCHRSDTPLDTRGSPAPESPSTGGPSTPRAGDGVPPRPTSPSPSEVPGGPPADDQNGGQTGEGGGPLDGCHAERWVDDDTAPIEAACTQVLGVSDGQHTTYRCNCDVANCPPLFPLDAPSPPDAGTGCHGDIEIDSGPGHCGMALEALCGLTPGQHGFCEQRSAWKSERLLCVGQADGTHLCQCPNLPEPVRAETDDCELALVTACSGDCETDAGHCAVMGKNHYACDCAVGLAGEVEAPLCEDALHWWCDPACENGRGACYWQPDGQRIACLCQGDPQLHITSPDPNEQGDECEGPLLRACGG